MPCERKNRLRHNTIAFWLTDEEKQLVEARIKTSGMKKGEYYRNAILGLKAEIVAGRYRSDRLAIILEELLIKAEKGDVEAAEEIVSIVQELMELIKRSN